jgi:TonB family protein
VSENRFLPSFCALLGAATLVCGTQLFLLETWDWDSTTLNVEPVAPTSATISIELSENKPAEPVAEHVVGRAPTSVEGATKHEIPGGSEPEVTQSLALQQPDVASAAPQSTASTQAQVASEDRPDITAEARVGDHTPSTSANVNLLVAEPRIMGEADVHRTRVVSTSANLFVAGITGEARVGDKTLLASANANLSVEAATKDEIADSEPAHEVTEVGSAKISELGTKVAGFDRAESTGKDGDAVALGSDSQITQAESQSPLPQETEPAQPLKAEAADNSPVAHAGKQAPPHGSTQRQQSKSIDDSVRQTGSISIAAGELKSRRSSPKVLLTQHASKPLKKKSSAEVEAKEKPMQKLAAKPNQHETKISEVTPRWKPMGLAPADKPSISATQRQPKRSDSGSYNAKIWSGLARKKPKAGQRGSTTVTFAIGPAGLLRYVRVSQSSSNPRLDQLAVATVRNAAPFPPPEVLKNGTAAYTIRIDFH